jgi:hypothetical protein
VPRSVSPPLGLDLAGAGDDPPGHSGESANADRAHTAISRPCAGPWRADHASQSGPGQAPSPPGAQIATRQQPPQGKAGPHSRHRVTGQIPGKQGNRKITNRSPPRPIAEQPTPDAPKRPITQIRQSPGAHDGDDSGIRHADSTLGNSRSWTDLTQRNQPSPSRPRAKPPLCSAIHGSMLSFRAAL